MCNISFTSLILNSAGTQLTLNGTSDCQAVVASVQPFTQQKGAPVDSSGNWSITYTGADMAPGHSLSELRERCGERVKIDSFCKEDDTCRLSDAAVLNCGDTEVSNDCGLICCMVFKLLALLGFGLAVLGAILMVCPGDLCRAESMDHIGLSMRIWGGLLMLIGLLFWIVLCHPKKCDWIAFFWQAFTLAGLLFIFAALCPECRRLLYFGLGALAVGLALYFWWLKQCDVSVCRRLSEWTGLFLIPVNLLVGLELILLSCANMSRITPLMILAAIFFLYELWLLLQLKKNNCLKC